MSLQGTNIGSAELAAVLRVGLGVEGNLLALVEGLVAVYLDSGIVDENVVASVVVGNEAKALFRVKPFDCACVHVMTSKKEFRTMEKISQNSEDI